MISLIWIKDIWKAIIYCLKYKKFVILINGGYIQFSDKSFHLRYKFLYGKINEDQMKSFAKELKN